MIIIWQIIIPFFFMAFGSPQTSGNAGRPSPADLVWPMPGSPVSVQQVEERTRSLPDGTSAVEVTEVKVYRDSSGRMRIEWRDPDASGESRTFVALIDPTSGSRVMLLAEEKIALHIVGPKLGEDGFALGIGGVGEGLPAGNWKTKT